MPWTGDSLHAAMVLFHHIIQILHLADDDRGVVRFIVSPDGGRIGLAPIDRDLLGHPMAADRLGEEPLGGWLIALGCQQEINGLAALIHRPIPIVPLAFDLDVRFIHPPTVTHQPLAAAKRLFQLGAVLQDPTIDRGVIHEDTTLLHRLFELAIAQRIGEISTDTCEDDRCLEVCSLEAHHGLSLPWIIVTDRGRSYPK
jgi:hypothetical protein